MPFRVPHLLARAHAFLLEEGPRGEADFWVPAGFFRGLLHLHRTPVSAWGEPLDLHTWNWTEQGANANMLTICTNRPQRSTCERMWACETLGGAWDSSVKQNWNLQKVPKAAPARTSFFLNALSAALRFKAEKQDSSWWGCDRTDYWLTEVRLMWEEGTRIYRQSWRDRRRREDISVGWLKLLMSCFASYLPSPVISLPLSGTFSAHGRAPPIWLRWQSEAGLTSFHIFSASFPVFLSDLISL